VKYSVKSCPFVPILEIDAGPQVKFPNDAGQYEAHFGIGQAVLYLAKVSHTLAVPFPRRRSRVEGSDEGRLTSCQGNF
jgi:hypothetical protein